MRRDPARTPTRAIPRVVVVFGTRPEAVKLAPLIRALGLSGAFEPLVVLTAQHREMVDQVVGLFDLAIEVDLDIMRPRQSLSDVTTRALRGLDRVLEDLQPDAVVVQGDTTTSFAGALAAHYHQLPVVHVEAGLRTLDRYSPFPEEMNRRLTSSLTSLHLTPTWGTRDNLVREGVEVETVVVTGNTVIDALLWAIEQRADYGALQLAQLDADSRPVIVVTAHRRESWGEPMAQLGRAIREIAQSENVLIILPAHRNPAVRETLLPPLREMPNVIVTEPLAYGGFSRLLNRAHLVITDSGGIQEEAPSLGKPVLVTRSNTERPEAVIAGTARLVGTAQDGIVREVRRLLHEPAAYADMSNAVNPYGDGMAAERSVQAIAHHFGLGPPAEEFGGGGGNERRAGRAPHAYAVSEKR
jgi:UDP-N-acetylglucosamine 2-epimerase (non-hydrolysing)